MGWACRLVAISICRVLMHGFDRFEVVGFVVAEIGDDHEIIDAGRILPDERREFLRGDEGKFLVGKVKGGEPGLRAGEREGVFGEALGDWVVGADQGGADGLPRAGLVWVSGRDL